MNGKYEAPCWCIKENLSGVGEEGGNNKERFPRGGEVGTGNGAEILEQM